MMLINNAIEDIIKVIRSLEIRRTSLKETTKKTMHQKGGFTCNLLGPLMKVDLLLLKKNSHH